MYPAQGFVEVLQLNVDNAGGVTGSLYDVYNCGNGKASRSCGDAAERKLRLLRLCVPVLGLRRSARKIGRRRPAPPSWI
jgi:hypothetical protein